MWDSRSFYPAFHIRRFFRFPMAWLAGVVVSGLSPVHGGWWTIFALPLLLFLAWRMIEFMRNENTGSDLFAIFSISYLIGIRAIGSYWPLGVILAACFIYLTIRLDRRERRDDPT
jgi:hypothetical protein